MAKSGACELCGLPDDSYSIEDNGNVFKVCKLCYDGFIAKHGSDSTTVEIEEDDDLAELMGSASDKGGAKPETLSPEEMAKLLKPDNKRRGKRADVRQQSVLDERRKIDAAVKRAVAAKVEQTLAADTEDITRELLEVKAEIEDEKRRREQARREEDERKIAEPAVQSDTGSDFSMQTPTDDVTAEQGSEHTAQNSVRDPGLSVLHELAHGAGQAKDDVRPVLQKSQAEMDIELDREIRAKRAEEKRLAAIRKAANPTIDDERIKITSPEVELPKDTRPKTNLDVASEGHIGAVRFLQAFKYVLHPVSYAVFAGIAGLAVFTALMITMTWKEAVIDLAACVGAVTVGALLVWYLKRRLEIDKRTVLLRIRQEQILFESMVSSCYRELKTKYPMIKAAAWLMGRLSVIVPTVIIIGGTAAGIITSFLLKWWMAAPVIAGAALGAVFMYYVLKLTADVINYKLDTERNQQIAEQTLLDLLCKRK